MRKRGGMLQKVLVQIIIIALVLSLLIFAVLGRGSKDDIKQELLEKQTALLIEASEEGTVLELNEQNMNGKIKNIRIEDNRIYVDVGAANSTKGYAFFSKYKVSVKKSENKFRIKIE